MRGLVDAATSLICQTLDWFLPPACLGCDESGHGLWCPRCVRTLPPALSEPLRLDGVLLVAAFPYAPPVSDAVRRLKYAGRTDLVPRLARLLPLDALARLAPNLVIPVPLHRRRLAARGFNQSALLARALARRLRVACDPRAHKRQQDTPQQAGQDRTARLANVRGAFVVHRSSKLGLRRVLLVDDVVTTGATASGCIAVLERAGAEVVGVASLCAALQH